jgi:hypothetical protein
MRLFLDQPQQDQPQIALVEHPALAAFATAAPTAGTAEAAPPAAMTVAAPPATMTGAMTVAEIVSVVGLGTGKTTPAGVKHMPKHGTLFDAVSI